MSRKKSAKYAANAFKSEIDRILEFTREAEDAKLTDQAMTWTYELALVKTAVAFEYLMLECIVCAVNNDTGTISAQTGIKFPKHLTDEVCEYLVTGGGYFDFKGARRPDQGPQAVHAARPLPDRDGKGHEVQGCA
ncbi:hypothetical protein [Streptomyces sp. RP5T]|uniref:hypothetical protein n=1 Tax=Streptomyces sp. RP5T TaxID=2490848 RepID=UPI000F64C7DD|nr:hypothetical protein [Streptomyces sp. RP5T]RRR83153.1 hypothetical protein EHS43_14945 [Streptomyces sp. RP5T]